VTYDSRDGEIVLLSVIEELQHIVTDNDTGLAGENILDTHDCCLDLYEKGLKRSAKVNGSVACSRPRSFRDR
jgi:hypothetical protein